MNLVDIVHKLWNNDGRDRPWGYVMPVMIVGAGNLDEEDGDAVNVPQFTIVGETHLGEVGGRTVVASASFTRPADTTAYTAKDTVSNSTSVPTVLTFSNLARIAGGSGYITKARLLTNQSTNTARFRLHLYHTAPTAINDNSPFTLLWANRAIRVGYIDFDAATTEGTGSDSASALNSVIRLAFSCTSASRTLYGALEAIDAFTPASGQEFFAELTAELN